MSGPIALHGGGEFQPGDEPFLQRLLDLARHRQVPANGHGPAADDPLRIAIVPTAAARGRPSLVGAHGTAAFERLAGAPAAGAEVSEVSVDVVPVLDPASAADAGLAGRLAGADVIHLPGGDPDLIPSILAGSPAWDAIVAAHRGGAVLAGASAGAMALAPWTWTPGGGIPGLGLVAGLVVVPHADGPSWAGAIQRFGTWLPAGLGLLGISERTGAIARPDEPGTWDVVGEGEVRWLAADDDPGSTRVVASGASLRLGKA